MTLLQIRLPNQAHALFSRINFFSSQPLHKVVIQEERIDQDLW